MPQLYQLLESVVAILLCFQLCSIRYTALQTKSNARSASAINPVTTETAVITVNVLRLSITGK